jgi:hypothetical protein
MHDGDLAHLSRTVLNVLCKTSHDKWLCRAGLVALPLQLTNLNRLWRHLKKLVYSAPFEQEETLHKLIFDDCQIKLHQTSICERVSVYDDMVPMH